MDIQKLVDAISRAGHDTRSRYHLTLGRLIDALKEFDPNMSVELDAGGAPTDPHSYRGYYSDLAFEVTHKPTAVCDLLACCNGALGQSFEGYKGGDFVMSADTPLWVSSYGNSSGIAMMGVEAKGGAVIIATRQVD